jgi:hypothetical protein
MAIIHVCVPLMLARIFVKSIHKFPTTDENGCKKNRSYKSELAQIRCSRSRCSKLLTASYNLKREVFIHLKVIPPRPDQ